MEEDKKAPKTGWFQNQPLLVFFWAVLPIVVAFGSSLAGPTPNTSEFLESQSFLNLSFLQFVSVIVMLVLPALLIAFVYKREIINFLGFNKKPELKHLGLGVVLILSANLFLNYLMDLNELIPLSENLQYKFNALQESTVQSQEFFLNFSGGFEFLIAFFIMAILPAITEEMYFRGLLIGILDDLKIGAFHIIFLSALLFAMMHFQFYYLLPLLFMGALLGYVYYRTKSLWVSILMHLLNNGLIVILTLSNRKELTNIDLEADPPIYLSLLGIVIFAAALYFFHASTKNISTNEE